MPKSRTNRKEEARQRENVLELLETVGLADVKDELATSLPYGKQRRLEIARALAAGPKAGNGAEGGGFARAVGADQRDDLAVGHLQGDAP